MTSKISKTTEIKTKPESSLDINNKSINASVDNSISASASIGINSNKNTGIEVGASVKTGTVTSAGAGMDGNNVFLDVSYSDTTEAHITANAKAGSNGVGVLTGVDAYAKSGTELELATKIGQTGVKVNAGASTGSYVGVDAIGTVNARGVSASGGAGVTVGEHLEAGGGAEATFEKGKINIGVSGDVAVLVGLEVDASVSIDTNQIQKDAETVAHSVVKTEKIVESEVKHITNDICKTEKKVENTAKKAGKDIKKGLKKVF
jgi:hypothetical protein